MADFNKRTTSDGSDDDYVDYAQDDHRRKMTLDKPKVHKAPSVSTPAPAKAKSASKSSVFKGQGEADAPFVDAPPNIKRSRARKVKQQVNDQTSPTMRLLAPHSQGYLASPFPGNAPSSSYDPYTSHSQIPSYVGNSYTQGSSYAAQPSSYDTQPSPYAANDYGNGYTGSAFNTGYQPPISMPARDNGNFFDSDPLLGGFSDQPSSAPNGYSGGFTPPPSRSQASLNSYIPLPSGGGHNAGVAGAIYSEDRQDDEYEDHDFELDQDSSQYAIDENPNKSSVPEKKTTKKKNGTQRATRAPRPKLRKWNELDWKKAIVGIVASCGEERVAIPFDRAAQYIHPNCTASALQQSLLKARTWLINQGEENVPRMRMSWTKKAVGPKSGQEAPSRRQVKMQTRSTQTNIRKVYGSFDQSKRAFKAEGEGESTQMQGRHVASKAPAGAPRERQAFTGYQGLSNQQPLPNFTQGIGRSSQMSMSAPGTIGQPHRPAHLNTMPPPAFGRSTPRSAPSSFNVGPAHSSYNANTTNSSYHHGQTPMAPSATMPSFRRPLPESFLSSARNSTQFGPFGRNGFQAANSGLSTFGIVNGTNNIDFAHDFGEYSLNGGDGTCTPAGFDNDFGSFTLGTNGLQNGPTNFGSNSMQNSPTTFGSNNMQIGSTSFNINGMRNGSTDFAINGVRNDATDLGTNGMRNSSTVFGTNAMQIGSTDFGTNGMENDSTDFGTNGMENGFASLDSEFDILNDEPDDVDGNNGDADISRGTDGTLDLQPRQSWKKPRNFRVHADLNNNHIRAWNCINHPPPPRSEWENAENWLPDSVHHHMTHHESREEGPRAPVASQEARQPQPLVQVGGGGIETIDENDFVFDTAIEDQLEDDPLPSPEQ